jgi:hypothetical protein
MRRPHAPCRSLAALAALASLLPSQNGIRLTRIPDLLRLPAAPGTNLLLEAELETGTADIWLATDRTSRDRIALTPAGERRWQLNLADPRVATMLPAGRDSGELFVFATIAGTTHQSAAVAWARNQVHDQTIRCLVRSLAGTTTTVSGDGTAWLDATKTERIELQGLASRQAAVLARFGEQSRPLQRRGDTGSWAIELDAALREQLHAATTLEIEANLGAASTVFRFALVPPTLALADKSTPLVIAQRRAAEVPGSNGWLLVHVDDITMGSTTLRVTSADGATVIAPQLMFARDFVELPLAGAGYVLVVDKLVNLLLGEDRAELQIRPTKGFVPDRIGQLLRVTAASDATFLFADQELPGEMARMALVASLEAHRGPAPTVDDFIDTIAARTSTTGRSIAVRCQDGTTVTMSQWLRERLRELDDKPAPTKK